MTSFDEVYEKIKCATHARTQMEVADRLEVSQSTISDAKRRSSIPPEWLVKLHDKYDLNIDWLRGKSAIMYNRDRGSSMAETLPPPLGGGLTSIPNLPPGPGVSNQNRTPWDIALPGAQFLSYPPAEVQGTISDETAVALAEGENSANPAVTLREESPTVPMPKSVLARILQTAFDYKPEDPEPEFRVQEYLVLPPRLVDSNTKVFAVDNEAMSPTLRKGAYVGVDCNRQNLTSGELYAMFMPHEGVAFRRIAQDIESGLFLLHCDHPSVPGSRLDAQTLRERVLGKVIWTLQPV